MRHTQRPTRPMQVITHLKERGRITEAAAYFAYGRFRLADAIYRLKTDKSHLVPKGSEIVTMIQYDAEEQPYAEYRLVSSTPAFIADTAMEARPNV